MHGRGHGPGHAVASHREPFDLVLLLNNIYYWPPADRPLVLEMVRALAPNGTVVVSTAVAGNLPFNRHLDLVLRVTKGSWRLPTERELADALRTAGFRNIDLLEPAPLAGMLVAIAS